LEKNLSVKMRKEGGRAFLVEGGRDFSDEPLPGGNTSPKGRAKRKE